MSFIGDVIQSTVAVIKGMTRTLSEIPREKWTVQYPDVPITVTGYPLGDGGAQVSCSGPTSRPDRGFPAVRCPGLVDGTSGSPWVSAAEIRGVVGGLQGGLPSSAN